MTALLVTFTNSFPSDKKVALQFAIFGAITAGGFAYSLQQSPVILQGLFQQFVVLPTATKFALSFGIIGCTYFGGAFYSIGLDSNEEKTGACESAAACEKHTPISPALADDAVTFEVPANLPAGDKEMFEFMLERYILIILLRYGCVIYLL